MAYKHGRAGATGTQVPPIVAELQSVFAAVAEDDVLTRLTRPKGRGRRGYSPQTLWRCYLAYYYLGLPSVSDLVRTLHDNPYVAAACGIEAPEGIPSQPTFSRFMTRLIRHDVAQAVKNVMRDFTQRLYETLPDFGRSVAIDSTDVKAWSNAQKRGKPHTSGKQRQTPRVGIVSDPDAGWCVKTNTEGNKKFVWGFKVHILADTTYELPMAIEVSSGNMHDVRRAAPLLGQARYTTERFRPEYVMCDAAYSSDPLREEIRAYGATPLIDPNPRHHKAVAETEKTAEWKKLYARRTAVERVNSRLKAHRKLNAVRVRGYRKLTIHALMATIVMQAQALASGTRRSVRAVC